MWKIHYVNHSKKHRRLAEINNRLYETMEKWKIETTKKNDLKQYWTIKNEETGRGIKTNPKPQEQVRP